MKVNSLVSDLKLREFNPTIQPFWKIRFFIIGVLLIIVGIFEFIPMVKQARLTIPSEIYEGSGGYSCKYILDSRPWYSTFNYLEWWWIPIVPLLISFLKTTMPKWQKIIISLFSVMVCYLIWITSVFLAWNITNDIFFGLDTSLTGGVDCFNYNFGPGLAVVVFLGWIPASIYVGFCLFAKWVFRNIITIKT